MRECQVYCESFQVANRESAPLIFFHPLLPSIYMPYFRKFPFIKFCFFSHLLFLFHHAIPASPIRWPSRPFTLWPKTKKKTKPVCWKETGPRH
jgi:hypothetical protein